MIQEINSKPTYLDTLKYGVRLLKLFWFGYKGKVTKIDNMEKNHQGVTLTIEHVDGSSIEEIIPKTDLLERGIKEGDEVAFGPLLGLQKKH